MRLVSLGFLILCNLTAVFAQTSLNDDFSRGLDPNRWQVEGAPGVGSQASVGIANQRLEVTKGSGPGGGGIFTVYSLAGDFDVQADYVLLNWPTSNGYSIFIRAIELGSNVSRLSSPSFGEAYGVGDTIHTPTADRAGALRLVRTGSTLSGYALSGGAWVGVGSNTVSTADTRISLEFGTTYPLAPGGVSAAFDNFAVNSGTPVFPGNNLMVAPTALSFAYQQGVAGPIVPRTITVSSTGSPLSFTAAASTTPPGGNWLSVSSGGTTPQGISVNVSGGLAAGTYNGQITITSPGVANNPQTIPVVLTVISPNTLVAPGLPSPIPDPGQVTFTLNVPTAGTIASMELFFQFTHQCERDLTMDLVAPDGKTDRVMDHGLLRCSGVSTTFTSDNTTVGEEGYFRGHQAQGVWKLIVTDTAAGNSGTLDAWSLAITVEQQNNSPVHFGPGDTPRSQHGSFAEPVNTATGNYFTAMTDLAVPGKGMGFVFTRSYNSADTYSGPFGPGWTHSFNLFLTANPDGSVGIKEAEGDVITFAPSGQAYIPVTTGVFDSLTKNADNSFTLTRKNRTKLNFGSGGQLTSIVDRNGNAQNLAYSGGKLTTITDSAGRVFTLSYDGNGHIVSLTDPLNRSIQYAYDSGGRLSSVKDPVGGTTQYTYDANNRMLTATDARSITYLQNTYDSSGRVVAQKNARNLTTTFAYNTPAAGTTTITDPLGNVTRHIHDSSLRLISVADAKGGTVAYTYDASNNRSSITNQNGKTTTLTYDSQGNATGITDALGNSTGLSFDSQNNLLSATNPKGKTTVFSYDSKGNLISIRDALGDTTTFSYNASGLLTGKTDANGATSTFAYDPAGNVSQITDALGNATKLSYDALGRLVAVTDPNGHTSTSAYDGLNRLVKIADPLGNQTRLSYDVLGSLLALTDANGNTTAYTYDPTSNLASVTDALGNLTRYTYDANGNRATFVNAKGNVTSYPYDGLNRLIQSTDPLSLATSYAYDGAGNLISKTDANGAINQFTYDAANRLVGITYADGNRVAYTYDANNSRTTMMDSSGTSLYRYDDLDRLTSVTDSRGKLVRYAYDPVGNRNSLFYPDGKSVSYDYDPANRLIEVRDWLGGTTAYKYDVAANLLQTRYPNMASISFAYDAANRLTQVANSALFFALPTISYTLDAVGNRTSKTVDGVTTTYGYDRLYELVSAQQGPRSAMAWVYDQVGNRVTEVTSSGVTPYTYDADNRLLSAGATTFSYDGNGNELSKTGSAGVLKYAYDSANRLIRATGAGINSSFSYDGDGNRVSQFTRSGTYNYVNDVATALPVVLNEQGPDGPITYAYGLSLFEEFSQDFNYFYHFDGLGSMVALTDASGAPTTAYGYDAWGNTLSIPDNVGARNKFRFTGEALDSGTGLYYLRARYYDPSVGRFLSRDPLNTWLPLTFRPYAYANNSPINLIDPSGLSAEPQGVVLGAFTTRPSTDFASTVGNNLIGALSKEGPIIPNLGNEILKSLLTDFAARLAARANLPRTSQFIRDIDTLSTPFTPDLGEAPRRVGGQAGEFTYQLGQGIFGQLNRVFRLQLPPLH